MTTSTVTTAITILIIVIINTSIIFEVIITKL